MFIVDSGASLRKKGIFLERIARSYSELVKKLPTTRAVNIVNIIGRNTLMDDVVSSMITSSEKVRRVYDESMAP